ncbi:MAG: tripartite tricarboxylate transporter permease [Pseudomonadota bacterium]
MIKVPYRFLGPSVVVVCALGTFSVHASFVETYLMFAAGIVGFFMRLYGFSPAALVLALVLGPLAEEALRQTMTISRGSHSVFFERTPSLWIIGVTIALLVKLRLLNWFGSTSAGEAEKAGS